MKKPQAQRELAKIHIAKKALGMDDDAYREMLKNIGGASSSKDLSPLGRAKVLDHLTRLAGGKTYPGRPHTTDQRALIKKIEALLADGGKSWDYGLALCRRIAKKDRFEFCTDEELRKVVAALNYQAKRDGAKQ